MGDHSKRTMPRHSLRTCPKCGVVKEFGVEFEECETCDPEGESNGGAPDKGDCRANARLHGPDPLQLAKDRADLMEALRGMLDHDGHPPWCKCGPCTLLARLNTGETNG